MKETQMNKNNFISNPYVQGAFMREDVFSVQFSVYVNLEIGILDNDQVSTYYQSICHFVGGASTVSAAVDLANQFIVNHSNDEGFDLVVAREYTSPEDSLISCFDTSVQIYDREQRLIMGGTFSGSIVIWEKPVTCISERIEVEAKIKAMLSEASFEAGWDNYSTAKRLREKATLISWKLPASPVVRSLYFNQEMAGRSDLVMQ